LAKTPLTVTDYFALGDMTKNRNDLISVALPMVAKASSPHVVVANVIAVNFANATTQLQAKMLMPFHLEDDTHWR